MFAVIFQDSAFGYNRTLGIASDIDDSESDVR